MLVFERFFRQFIRIGYIVGIAILVVSLAHSKFFMSFSQFVLAGAFVLERFNIRKAAIFLHEKSLPIKIILVVPYFLYLAFESISKGLKEFIRNKPALIFTTIMLLHLAGLIFTTDFNYAAKDLRTKLPLFLLPLFITTSQPFGKKAFYYFILLFATSVLVRTIINTWNLVHMNFVDIRDISTSISHLVVALLIAMAIFYLGYLIQKKRIFQVPVKILFLLLILWFLVYLIITQSATGIVISAVIFFILLPVLVFRSQNRWIRTGLLTLMSGSLLVIGFYLLSVVRDYQRVTPVDFSKLEPFTPRGNRYVHNTRSYITENGNYVYIYIQWDELKQTWNKRSTIALETLDKRSQKILGTLLRFLTSKGLRKDADGVNALTNEEVRAVENGVTNVLYLQKFSIRGRIYEFLDGYNEYMRTDNPTGSTVMQRLEFWRASVGLIKDNWLTGVGTGDMNIAFERQYQKMHSKLAPENRWRSHNQFLSILVGFGLFGFLWFLFAVFYPPFVTGKYHDYFFLIFIIISVLSMITEDTIESQAGVTFFAFFYVFLMFGRRDDYTVT